MKSKWLYDESINSLKTSDYRITPNLTYYGTKTRVKFNGSCLKQDRSTFNDGIIANIYIVYKISRNFNIRSHPIYLEHLVWLNMLILISTNILDMELYLIDMDFVTHPNDGTDKNIIIFGVDMSSSKKNDNRKKDISILGKGPPQGLEHALSAENMYSINFTENNKISF